MILDWFPPSPFTRVDPPTGGVSIDYTVHLHRTLPPLRDGEWLGGHFRADVSEGGIALEHGTILDPDGRDPRRVLPHPLDGLSRRPR